MQLTSLKKRLGDILVDVGIIAPEQLKEALEIQKRTREKLGTILSQMGALNEEVMLAFLGKQCGVLYVSLNEYGDIPENVVRSVPESLIRKQTLLPIFKEDKTITIAMADPFNVFAVDDIKMMTGYDVKVVIASEGEIRQAISKYFSSSEGSVRKEGILKDLLPNKTLNEDEFLNLIINHAVGVNSSEIHFEPENSEVRIRYRVDGVLHEQAVINNEQYSKLCFFLKKVSGNLSLDDKSVFDGQLKLKIPEGEVFLKIHSINTIKGSRILIRLKLMTPKALTLNKLGFEPETIALFKKSIEAPSGLILISGPVDSGRTSTLYSTISDLNHPDKYIVTIENPVEYIIPGITQVQIETENVLNLHALIKRVSVQNPDILMIDEVPDKETLTSLIGSAISGQLVLASIVAGDTVGTIKYLQDMNIESFLISSSLLAVVAQRLMRTLCRKCREEYEIDAGKAVNYGVEIRNEKRGEKIRLYSAKGCPECSYTGYSGRTAIFEILDIDEDIRTLILNRAKESELREESVKKSVATLRQTAWKKVCSGITTIEEMLRVTKTI